MPGKSGELVRGPDSPAAAGPEVPEHTPAPARLDVQGKGWRNICQGREEALDETRIRKDTE